jgi:hypothetical protein
MQFRYGFLRRTLFVSTKRIAVLVGLVLLPLTTTFEKIAHAKPLEPATPLNPATPAQDGASDPRTVCLKKFLAKLHCPVSSLSEEFIHAADDNQLDWRLLPSISVIESGGGKAYKNNNIFGWNNGAEPFPTIRAGLHEVAYKLGRSPLYRNHDLLGKLRLYNPNQSYASSVLEVMNRISPVANLTSARRLVRRQNEFVYAD